MNIDIMTALGSYAFPVVACCAMAWYVKYCTDKNREQVDNITQQHKEEMSKVTSALNNNTRALEKLCMLIGGVDHD